MEMDGWEVSLSTLPIWGWRKAPAAPGGRATDPPRRLATAAAEWVAGTVSRHAPQRWRDRAGDAASGERQPHIALYIDRILKGATPADLPVEQPATLDLKTAKTLGLTIRKACCSGRTG